jgi:glycosyltransferase involved in cell wall biosynthesis
LCEGLAQKLTPIPRADGYRQTQAGEWYSNPINFQRPDMARPARTGKMPSARRTSVTRPLVSIILPTYNRARFLPEALSAIAAQTLTDWELIVVDDGSTDDTPEVIRAHAATVGRPLRYVPQANGGAYAARNTGLAHASGECVAFYDSDDLWLPRYLERLAGALARHPEVAWAYAACRSVDQSSGRELASSTFYEAGRPRPFLALRATRDEEGFRVIDDPGLVACQIEYGLYAGLQNSLIRRSVFEHERFCPDYRVVEDVLFLIRRLAEGMRIGYYDEVQVTYRVHDDNSSASVSGAGSGKLLPVYEEQVLGLESLQRSTTLTPGDARALRRRLAHVAFWHLGYAGYWQRGDGPAASRAFRRALRVWPWSPSMWKTWLATEVRRATGFAPTSG